MTEEDELCADAAMVGRTRDKRAIWRRKDGYLFRIEHHASGTAYGAIVHESEITTKFKKPRPWKA